jgi:hypothetical protein
MLQAAAMPDRGGVPISQAKEQKGPQMRRGFSLAEIETEYFEVGPWHIVAF